MTDVKDTGPLTWNVPIVDVKSGRPTPEFQRRWEQQRSNNSLIGSISFGTGAPTGTPDDGKEYIDTSTTPYTLYVGKAGTWHQVSPKTFLDLTDTPSSYSTKATYIVRVNAGASALEFINPSTLSANPTATASDTAVNGSASTFMRSDAAPAIQKATSGQFGLVKVDGTTITASGGVISASGGGGGGSGYEASPTKPLATNFTLLNTGTASMADGVNGLRITAPSATTNMRLAKLTAGPPATPYTITTRTLPLYSANGGSYPGGLFLMNSSSGKILYFGRYGATGMLAQYFNSYTSFNSNIISPVTYIPGAEINWYRIVNNGTTISFQTSSDGYDWYTWSTTTTLAAFLTSVDTIGMGVMVNGTPGDAVFQSFTVV